jgi:hypothetical protein
MSGVIGGALIGSVDVVFTPTGSALCDEDGALFETVCLQVTETLRHCSALLESRTAAFLNDVLADALAAAERKTDSVLRSPWFSLKLRLLWFCSYSVLAEGGSEGRSGTTFPMMPIDTSLYSPSLLSQLPPSSRHRGDIGVHLHLTVLPSPIVQESSAAVSTVNSIRVVSRLGVLLKSILCEQRERNEIVQLCVTSTPQSDATEYLAYSLASSDGSNPCEVTVVVDLLCVVCREPMVPPPQSSDQCCSCCTSEKPSQSGLECQGCGEWCCHDCLTRFVGGCTKDT